MKQRTLGRSLTVSEIGLGCMSLTGAYGATANVPREDAIALTFSKLDGVWKLSAIGSADPATVDPAPASDPPPR